MTEVQRFIKIGAAVRTDIYKTAYEWIKIQGGDRMRIEVNRNIPRLLRDMEKRRELQAERPRTEPEKTAEKNETKEQVMYRRAAYSVC